MNQKAKSTRKSKRGSYEIEQLDDTKLPSAVAERFEQAIKEADKEDDECRVNFRWGIEQLKIVKRAAEAIGVPYQTYIKMAVYAKAMQDLSAFRQASNIVSGRTTEGHLREPGQLYLDRAETKSVAASKKPKHKRKKS